MKTTLALALATAASFALASAALAAPPTKTGTTAKGSVLTDTKGMTLYTFDKDTEGKSACNGPCATNWPVLKAEASDKAEGGYTIISPSVSRTVSDGFQISPSNLNQRLASTL